MSVHIYQHQLSYFSVPKNACSSLKNFFFEVENGHKFCRFRVGGKKAHVHQFMPSIEFNRMAREKIHNHWKVAVVRDPVKRFLSCYSNRVIYHQDLSNMKLKRRDRWRGFSNEPTLSEFINQFEGYRRKSKLIRHHTNHQTYYLGTDPDYFDRIYSMRELDRLADDVRSRVPHAPKMPHLQTGGPKISVSDLTDKERKKIESFYAADYEVFGQFM